MRLEDLSPADVRYRRTFELLDYWPISSLVRRFPRSYDELVKHEINNMLKARTLEQVYSPWASPVVITREKDSQPRLCVLYTALSMRMKGDKFPIPNIEEILDDMIEATVFIKLHMLALYWQIPLAEHVQEMTALTCKYGTL